MYRCPVTEYRVQGFSAEDTSEDRHTYEPVTCPACRQIHHVNPATGAVLGEKVESASVTSVGGRGAISTGAPAPDTTGDDRIGRHKTAVHTYAPRWRDGEVARDRSAGFGLPTRR